VLANGPTLGDGHQTWRMNEINELIWPAPLGVGIMDPESFQITADIAEDYKVIKTPATDEAYRTDLAEAAVEELRDDGLDVEGESWTKPTVKVTPGGE
jgi:NitT/TauT family transport system substrate-binding protein